MKDQTTQAAKARDRRHAIIAGGITVAIVPCTDECDHSDGAVSS